jgi:predicted kinase
MNNKPQAIITIGCSASGKSTFAEDLCRRNPNEWVEVNRDNIRFKDCEKNWNKYKFTKKSENKVTVEWDRQLDSAMSCNKNIILSDTNINEYYRSILIKKLDINGYEVIIKEFPVEFDELLRRDMHRSGSVGYEVLLRQYITYQRRTVNKYEPTKGSNKAYIVDIDGTLAINTHRDIFNYTKILTDTPNEHVVNVIKGLMYLADYKIIFLSGRDDSCRKDTLIWLQTFINSKINDDALLMRRTGDRRKDYIVKMELFNNHIRNVNDVLAVIDDRKQVMECCWSVLGLNIINVGVLSERF